mmetsp:Transcript_12416/g.18303  ORF Transcript_12416/g.18303 Transcript_12416/m.18303 type:complete len:217 (-) Transcript_12416:211-861(-)
MAAVLGEGYDLFPAHVGRAVEDQPLRPHHALRPGLVLRLLVVNEPVFQCLLCGLQADGQVLGGQAAVVVHHQLGVPHRGLGVLHKRVPRGVIQNECEGEAVSAGIACQLCYDFRHLHPHLRRHFHAICLLLPEVFGSGAQYALHGGDLPPLGFGRDLKVQLRECYGSKVGLDHLSVQVFRFCEGHSVLAPLFLNFTTKLNLIILKATFIAVKRHQN